VAYPLRATLYLPHADLIPPHFTESLLSDTLPTMPDQVISEPDSCANIASCASSPLFDKRRQR
ncbi:hypothetical protein NYV53_24260, partial [Escherichia coli]|uniref:hypothetical protein n=1 Tax=Escherichia coli TaxID=562 RepID=UPI0022389C75